MEPVKSYLASEVGWLLLALCRVGELCAARGYCVGDLRPDDVRVENGQLTRRRSRGLVLGAVHVLAGRKHQRVGHDGGCEFMGVPLATTRRLLRAWGGDECERFFMEAVDEAILDVESGASASMLAALEYAIGGRISVRAPANQTDMGYRIS